jgi:hypothetical protein
MRRLSADLTEDTLRPYFLWDEDLSIGDLKGRLKGSDQRERLRLLAKLLREARDIDVWRFVTPAEVADALPAVRGRLGRRRAFWEFLVEGWRADGLVWDRAPQAFPEKRQLGAIRIDPLEEILVNKLTTILSRAEERDIVDLFLLEKAGYRIESALEAALAKDGGCSPGALAWVISEIQIPDGALLPAGVSPADLRAFLEGLIRRLRRAALP